MHNSKSDETYALGAVAALYAWLVKDGKSLPVAAFYIASPLVALAGWRALGLYRRVNEIAKYLRMIEKEFFTTTHSLPGWETYLAKDGSFALVPTAATFWIVLLLVTFIAPPLLRV